MDSLKLVGGLVCDRDDTEVVKVGGKEWFLVVLEGEGTVLDFIVDEKGVQEAEAVEVSGTESVAVVLEAVGTVVDFGTDEQAVASADTVSDFCWLALLAGTMAHPDAESWRFPMFTDCFATSAANWSSLSVVRV